MRAARRLDSLPIYVFALLDAKLKAARAQGVDVIKLDIGSPDGPPPESIVTALAEVGERSDASWLCRLLRDARLRQAMVDYYATRFGVTLDVCQRSSAADRLQRGHREHGAGLAGSGRPGPGARSRLSDLPDERSHGRRRGLRDAAAGGERVSARSGRHPAGCGQRRARLMWLNYPNNPTGADRTAEFL